MITPRPTSKTEKLIDQTVFKPWHVQKSGFPKTRVSSPVASRGVYISRNDPQKKTKSGKLQKHHKSSFVDKMASFFVHFFRKSLKEINQTVFKLDFWPRSWFPKNPGLVSGSPPRGVYISRNDPSKTYFLGNDKNIKKPSLFDKMASFVMPFFGVGPPKKA